MLYRGVYNPTVASLVPETLEKLPSWQGEERPSDEILSIFALDLKRLANDRTSGQLAEEVNRALPGSSSVIKSSARKLRRVDDSELANNGAAILIDANAKWAEPEIWQALKKTGQVYTAGYYLTALDLENDPDGGIQRRETQIYVKLYGKTLRMALIITILTVILGYPLAYFMANSSSGTANLLMVFVLLPFWTSLLVRTTAWIALLQTNGVVNSTLLALGLTDAPLEMLYTQFSTIIAMTHILLPFMILPLYSVMRGIDPSYMRAAMSMGSPPIPAFLRIYLPMSLPGLSAGALLVFIISVGYYITPALVGGTDGQMISNIIAFHMQQSNNWELAAALGSLLLFLILALYWLYDRFVGAGNIKLG
ncbi:ABC transporter permease subunit [Ruegeria sp. HKCCD5849]|nr:ABC transporter permease subunit [Ruegeria sp. HKCCD7296]NOD49275.1 ABC transporter permease subunit [Ruegeria sp. HKCCD5849]NOD53426.1 ABC transporter permease subunit [Ruegeria sp. HKCCD5851]NOD70264.1 ABC transporter permease subunit [Ruegeria sp. HKCCD7303]NOE34473.1 ABC transporter permease subunit [Ruegeria sp. HKCCD7318]NOE43078.1 ABC transporter permease subunit [Ruegeria sp. HKCCD7319]